MTLKVLDLFSGIGGFSLGLERAGMETVAFCEIEPFPRKVLAKHWPDVPIFKDIRTLTVEELPDDIGLICGGYPCQPFSTAGNRGGEQDDRHLWPEMYRIIKIVRPRWVIAENVAGHISMGLDEVLFDLERAGYAWWTFVIPACALDAHHRRDRVWIVANSQGIGHRKRRETGNISKTNGRPDGQVLPEFGVSSETPETLADTLCQRQPGQGEYVEPILAAAIKNWQTIDAESGCISGIWATEPSVGRVANGIPNRVDRLKGLGNAVVPQIPELIGRAIMEAENDRPGNPS